MPKHCEPTKTRDTGTTSLKRWIFVYLPILGLIIAVLYVLVELMIKHLAVRSVQEQLRSLPEKLEDLPVAPVGMAQSNQSITGGGKILPKMVITTSAVPRNHDFGGMLDPEVASSLPFISPT